jgi:DNA-binding FadR family transcriptional regulator
MTGDVKVGDLLPSERDIATQLGISRTSVREAIHVLADAGLVSRRAGAGGGTRVIRDVIPAALLGKAMELSQRRIMDMLEIRSVLEIASAELAAVRVTPDSAANIQEVVRRAQSALEGSSEEPDLFTSLETMFHLAVAKATQNEALLRMIRTSTAEVTVAIDMIPIDPSRRKEFEKTELSTMAAVLSAILERDPNQARAAMSHHLSCFAPIVAAYFEQQE